MNMGDIKIFLGSLIIESQRVYRRAVYKRVYNIGKKREVLTKVYKNTSLSWEE